MGIGHLTKTLAQQALGDKVKDVVDSLRPSESQPAPEAQSDNVAAAAIAQLQAMQRALKEDEELLVVFQTAGGTLRLVEIFAPNPRLLVLTGLDGNKNVVRVISGVEAVQLVCRPTKLQSGAKALPIRIAGARAKE